MWIWGSGTSWRTSPEEFTQREIDFLTDRFRGHPDVPAFVDRGGRRPHDPLRPPEGEPITVTGRQADLLGWLAGRRDGAALTTDGGPLPALPPL